MKKLYNICLYLIVLLVIFFQCDMMFFGLDFVNVEAISTIRYTAPMFLISLSITFLYHNGVCNNNISKYFTVFMIYVFFIAIFFSLIYPLTSREDYIMIILPLLLFAFMTIYSWCNNNNNIVIWLFSFVIILLSINFIVNYSENIYGTILTTAGSYNILYFLPFTLCHSNKLFRSFFITLVAILLLLSMKLGGIMAFSLAIIVYLYISQVKFKNKRINLGGFIVTIALLIGMVYLFLIINEEMLGGMLVQRIDDVDETGGSGRLDIYKSYIEFIKSDGLINYITGHGWWGSLRDSHVGVTCHNDFLECFIDFGILGFSFYLLFIYSLIKQCKKMIKAKHVYAPAMGASLAMFLTNSMVSHILIYPKFFMIFALFWGFIVSSTRNFSTNLMYKI